MKIFTRIKNIQEGVKGLLLIENKREKRDTSSLELFNSPLERFLTFTWIPE